VRRTTCRRTLHGLALAASLGGGPVAWAIWVGDTSPPLTAQAPLQFRLELEKFLFLQVGSPGAVVDTVSFDLASIAPASGPTSAAPPFVFGSGAPLDAAGSGTLQVTVRSNTGTVNLSASNNGGGLGLGNGAGRYVDYAQILTISDNPGLPAPVLSNAGSTTVTVSGSAQGGRVTSQTARWTYRFANTVALPSGRYTGQVTYTAISP